MTVSVPDISTPDRLQMLTTGKNPRVSGWVPVDLKSIVEGRRTGPVPSVLRRDDGIMLLYPGRINVLLGEPEGCKTWAAAIATAQELLKGHHAIWLDFEDSPETAVERLQALMVPSGVILDLFTYYSPTGLFDELAEGIFDELIAEKGMPSLIVGDGVTEAMTDLGLSPDKGVDVAEFYAGFPRSWPEHRRGDDTDRPRGEGQGRQGSLGDWFPAQAGRARRCCLRLRDHRALRTPAHREGEGHRLQGSSRLHPSTREQPPARHRNAGAREPPRRRRHLHLRGARAGT